MRLCTRCKATDKRIMLRNEPCTCGEGMFASDDDHQPHCLRVGHDVVEFIWPELLKPRAPDLIADPAARLSLHGWALPERYRRDWTLREYQRGGVAVPNRYVRTRVLCHACINLEMETHANVKDYRAASDRAGGKRDRARDGWAGQVAMQDSL